MYSFNIERPTSVADAVSALGGDEAQALSGGQTLIPTLKARLASPTTLVSLTGITDMAGIDSAGGTIPLEDTLKRQI